MLQIKHISLSLCPLPCLPLLCVCVGRESIFAVCVTRKSTFQFDFMTLLAKHQHEKTKQLKWKHQQNEFTPLE